METPTPARRVEYRPLDRIIRTTLRNPKRHADATLVASIRRFGFVDLVVEDGRTGELIAGHGRLDALEALREEHPGDPPDGVELADDGAWQVPISVGWSSGDDGEAEALALALNTTPIAGGFDRPELAELLADLARAGALDGTGYDTADVDRLLSELAPATSPADEWDAAGMPPFTSTNRQSAFAMTVHFLTHEDALRFAKEVLGEDDARRSVWWPKHDGFVGSDQTQEWVADRAAEP